MFLEGRVGNGGLVEGGKVTLVIDISIGGESSNDLAVLQKNADPGEDQAWDHDKESAY